MGRGFLTMEEIEDSSLGSLKDFSPFGEIDNSVLLVWLDLMVFLGDPLSIFFVMLEFEKEKTNDFVVKICSSTAYD